VLGPLPVPQDESASEPSAGPADAADDPEIVGELQGFLRAKLPAYMVPSSIVLLAELPLTANGKVNRAALPAAEGLTAAREQAYVGPASELEEVIAGIMRDVLGLEKVSVDDSFFELGGNSVHLVQVHGRLREALGREVPLIEMFRNPTVRALAQFLGGQGAAREPLAESIEIADRLAQGHERRRQRLDRGRRMRVGDEEPSR
jgi:acyl carrier protein